MIQGGPRLGAEKKAEALAAGNLQVSCVDGFGVSTVGLDDGEIGVALYGELYE